MDSSCRRGSQAAYGRQTRMAGGGGRLQRPTCRLGLQLSEHGSSTELFRHATEQREDAEYHERRPRAPPDSSYPLGWGSLSGFRRHAGKRTAQRENGA